ncbi:FOG: GGDEF domain [Hahella chejuensis KCTC 2396]|uniref:FOG: GGDEF domain n=1 Tax=Hahella chejuensis (strain KCTC 2396) TaxID=349521 RepID=Q2SP96_HAHCH|nr:sensor domain-containing diguanylate cyclase [Hahella chejuensis]ABC27528.1 FOG: GGDEF domain [Hahella chejuensis KCTC 2396]
MCVSPGRSLGVFFAVGVLWGMLACNGVLAITPGIHDATRRVLFISSYHPQFPTFSEQIRGLNSAFDGQNIELDIEFMDSKRLNSPDHYQRFHELLKGKLEALPAYELLIVGDDNALNFALERQAELFAATPIVFFGVNDARLAASLSGRSGVTGVVEAISMDDTVQLMRRLYGAKAPITVITDATTTGRNDLRSFIHFMTRSQDRNFRVLSLEQLSFGELYAELRAIPASDPVLLISPFRDKNGATLEFQKSLSLIRDHLKAPLFHLWMHGIGQGILGGKVISHFEQARVAANIGLRALRGEKVGDIPVVTDSPNRYVFDFREMLRFDIGEDDLPLDSLLLFRPVTLYQQHKALFWGVVLIVGFLALLVMLLIVSLRMRVRTQREVMKINIDLESKVKERTEQLEEKNTQLSLVQAIAQLGSFEYLPEQWSVCCNAEFCSMVGLPFEARSLSVEAFMSFIHPSDREELRNATERALKINQPFHGCLRTIRKDGSLCYFNYTSRPISHRDGRTSILGSVIDVTQLKEAESRFKEMANHDDLTGLANRRLLDELFTKAEHMARRCANEIVVLYCDLDKFKPINDQYGHDVGDAVLVAVAQRLRESFRESDTVARIGGDEFVILLNGHCSKDQLHGIIHKTKHSLRGPIHIKNVSCNVDVSIGYAAYPGDGACLDTLLNVADNRMYQEKQYS